MGDINLFRLADGQAGELHCETVAVEKSQTLMERYLDTLLGVRFLASEYSARHHYTLYRRSSTLFGGRPLGPPSRGRSRALSGPLTTECPASRGYRCLQHVSVSLTLGQGLSRGRG